MSQKKYYYKQVEYDSQEEIDFVFWLEDAQQNSLINNWQYKPKSYLLFNGLKIGKIKQLKTKAKEVEKHVLHKHSYTPDFEFTLNWRLLGAFENILLTKNIYTDLTAPVFLIDVKGGFQLNQSFPLNQKWLWQQHGLFVNAVIPHLNGLKKESCFFAKTFTPEKFRFTTTGKRKKIDYNVKSCKEFINNLF